MANGYSTNRRKVNELGQQAPNGYHYMPDGRLMSDAEHYARFGPEYTINDFIIDYADIKQNGETRRFSISGTQGAEFSIFVTNEDNNYYNFETNAFQSVKYTLHGSIGANDYIDSITFPKVSDADKYEIFLFAEISTKHASYREV